jgi:hypothetical protein
MLNVFLFKPKLKLKFHGIIILSSSAPVFNGVRVTRSLDLYLCVVDLVCPFVLFLLAIVLSVLLRYTESDCPFGVFKLFLQNV